MKFGLGDTVESVSFGIGEVIRIEENLDMRIKYDEGDTYWYDGDGGFMGDTGHEERRAKLIKTKKEKENSFKQMAELKKYAESLGIYNDNTCALNAMRKILKTI